MGIIVGGPKAWKVKRSGEVVVAFHWINGEPSLVLFPMVKRIGAVAYVVPLPMAHTYVSSSGYPTAHGVQKCVKAAQVMAMEPSKSTVHGIMTAILDSIEDLVKMPPEPESLKRNGGAPVGEASIKLGGKTIFEGTVNDLPPGMGQVH